MTEVLSETDKKRQRDDIKFEDLSDKSRAANEMIK